MRDYKQFYINGEWVDPAVPNDFEVINPATEEPCAVDLPGFGCGCRQSRCSGQSGFSVFQPHHSRRARGITRGLCGGVSRSAIRHR